MFHHSGSIREGQWCGWCIHPPADEISIFKSKYLLFLRYGDMAHIQHPSNERRPFPTTLAPPAPIHSPSMSQTNGTGHFRPPSDTPKSSAISETNPIKQQQKLRNKVCKESLRWCTLPSQSTGMRRNDSQ